MMHTDSAGRRVGVACHVGVTRRGSVARRATLGLIVLALLLAGCGSTQTQVRTETVPVMVAVPVDPPAVEVPDRPELPLGRLDSTNAPRDVVRAYAASVRLLQRYARQLEALLRPYAKRPSPDGND